MVQSDPWLRLPTSDELPCSDDIPVDNEDQNFIPNFLLFLLEFIWANRKDWFWGVDMGVYHTTGVSPQVPIVPDGFLSLGVERRKGNTSRKSYLVWEENNIAPIFVLEIVSLTYGGEYDTKMRIYAKLGVLYYVVYNPDYWRRSARCLASAASCSAAIARCSATVASSLGIGINSPSVVIHRNHKRSIFSKLPCHNPKFSPS